MPTEPPGQRVNAANWWAFTRETPQEGVYAATMGCYSAYGTVFTAPTINYALVLNEWDTEGGYYRMARATPTGDQAFETIAGFPCLGNPHLHRITRNVLGALTDRTRNVVAAGTFGAARALLLQSPAMGEVSYWLFDGSTRKTGSVLDDGTDLLGPGWRLAVAAPLTNANAIDVVFQQISTGKLRTCSLTYDGTAVRRSQTTDLRPEWWDAAWELRATIPAGPLQNVLVFKQRESSGMYFWRLDGTAFVSGGDLLAGAGILADDRLAASIVRGSDGRNVLLFQRSDTVIYRSLDADLTLFDHGSIGWATGTDWSLAAASNGLVFQHTNGQLYRWQLDASLAVTTGGDVWAGSNNPHFL